MLKTFLGIVYLIFSIVVFCYIGYLGIFKPNPTLHDVAFIAAMAYVSVSSRQHSDKCC